MPKTPALHTAAMLRREAKLVQTVARAQRRRAEALRAVSKAYAAEARATEDERARIILARHAEWAATLTKVVEHEAVTLDGEAARSARQADVAEARGQAHGDRRPHRTLRTRGGPPSSRTPGLRSVRTAPRMPATI